mgnify:CR=1 FL=1
MKDFLKKRSVKFALGGALLGLLVSFSDTENGIIANILSGILLGLIVYGIAYLCYYRRKDKKAAKLAAAEKAKQEKIAKVKAEKAAKEAEEKRRREDKKIYSEVTVSHKVPEDYYEIIGRSYVQKNLLHLRTKKDYSNFKDYVILDTETTGLNKQTDKIIEIAMIKVQNGEIADQYQTLVNPDYAVWPNAQLAVMNDITNDELKAAPIIDDIISDVMAFKGDLPFVGHNANFDISFIERELSKRRQAAEIDYYDTISIAKDAIPGLRSYKLSALMEYLGHNEPQKHRALDDAKETLFLLQSCIDLRMKEFERERLKKAEEKAKKEADREIIRQQCAKSPLLDVGIAFTGAFESDYNAMIKALTDVGGIEKGSISKKCSYLVRNPDKTNGYTSKYVNALEFIKNGEKIQIINEKEFWQLIENAKKAMEE